MRCTRYDACSSTQPTYPLSLSSFVPLAAQRLSRADAVCCASCNLCCAAARAFCSAPFTIIIFVARCLMLVLCAAQCDTLPCYVPFSINILVACCLALALCVARRAMRAAAITRALLRPLHDHIFCRLLFRHGAVCCASCDANSRTRPAFPPTRSSFLSLAVSRLR